MFGGGTNASGVGEGCSADGEGAASTVGLATGSFSGRRSAIWSNRGWITKKNAPASTPPPSNKKRSTPPMIQGTFDFGFATGGAGNGADVAGACCGRGADVARAVCVGKDCDTCCGGGGGGDTCAGGGGETGGGGGACAGGAAFEMSAVFGAAGGIPVGPVFRGSATVAG